MVLNYLPQEKLPENIQNPYPIIFGHTFMKGMQVGTVFATLYGFYIIRTFPIAFVNALPKATLLGVTLSTVMTAAMVQQSNLEKNQSRAFRIPKNPGIDDFMLIGCVGGILLSRFIGRGYLKSILFGGSLGTFTDFGLVVQEHIKYNY